MVPTNLDDIRAQLREMLPALRERYGVGRLWVVGSRARGDHRTDSDLDLMVEFERRGISLFGFAGLEIAIEDRLGLKVDLVEEGALKPRVASEMAKDAILI
jgi:predicted nucleotidyltransferase